MGLFINKFYCCLVVLAFCVTFVPNVKAWTCEHDILYNTTNRLFEIPICLNLTVCEDSLSDSFTFNIFGRSKIRIEFTIEYEVDMGVWLTSQFGKGLIISQGEDELVYEGMFDTGLYQIEVMSEGLATPYQVKVFVPHPHYTTPPNINPQSKLVYVILGVLATIAIISIAVIALFEYLKRRTQGKIYGSVPLIEPGESDITPALDENAL